METISLHQPTIASTRPSTQKATRPLPRPTFSFTYWALPVCLLTIAVVSITQHAAVADYFEQIVNEIASLQNLLETPSRYLQ